MGLRFASSRVWRCVFGRLFTDVSKDRVAIIFGIKQSRLVELLARECEGNNLPKGTVSLARRLEYSVTPLRRPQGLCQVRVSFLL